MVNAAAPLSTAEQFARDGYVVLPGALPAAMCSKFGTEILDEYQRLIDAGWKFNSSGQLAGHLNLAAGPSGRALLAALGQAGVPHLIEQLCGEPMALAQAAGNLNLPGSCHQDFHIDGDFSARTLIANVCLVPTDDHNGATALVPASHIAPLAYWQFRQQGWSRRAVRPTLAPGDVLLRPSNLWHRGTPNHSKTARPMAAFVWATAGAVDPAQPERELTRPLTIYGNKYYGRWRKFKEFTAVRLPWLDEAIRLGRSRLTEGGTSA